MLDARFGLLRQVIESKAQEAGTAVVAVDPKYSSQTCSRCGHVAVESRRKGRFACVACGFIVEVDVNTALEIRRRAQSVPEAHTTKVASDRDVDRPKGSMRSTRTLQTGRLEGYTIAGEHSVLKNRKVDQALTLARTDLLENSVLAGLNESDVGEVLRTGKLIGIETPRKIYEADSPIEDVYFPIDAVLSVVTHMRNGASIEVGTVGREGFSAIPLLLGATTSENESYCQVRGRVVAITREHFMRLLRNADETLLGVLNRFLQAYVNMLGQLAACNGMHSIYKRCARWLLLTHDRVNSDTIALTHEYLAMMLGSRRSSVTTAAAALQNAGLIRYAHGEIHILNRKGLENASCECYEVARAQFGRLLNAENP
jgi:CRP-like cAMP-binding protein/ribosomal protein L37E